MRKYRLKIIKACEFCGEKFHPWHKENRFCSRKCLSNWMKNEKLSRKWRESVSKALKGKRFSKLHRKHLSEATKGHKPNSGSFKKGNIPWNKDKKWPEMSGSSSPCWKGGSKKWWRDFYLKERGSKCEAKNCDWKLTLQIHHLDGDSENWNDENILVLCPNHHSLTPDHMHQRGHQKFKFEKWMLNKKKILEYIGNKS